MKGRLKTGISISENEMLAIGTDIEIVDGWAGCDGNFYKCEISGGKQVVVNANSIQITDYSPSINWEQRRYELAKSAMQGYCIVLGMDNENGSATYNDIAINSLKVADALVYKLKNRKE